MRAKLLSACILAACSVHGQQTVDVEKNAVSLSSRVFYTAGGHPVSAAKYVRLTGGSPYFSENWMKGAIIVSDSMEYSNLRLRLDLLDNTLLYLNDNNEEMVSVSPINKVSLRDTTTGANYLFTYDDAHKSWYQVLSMGKVSLYKQHFKQMVENKPYGSSITEQTIRTEERYFIMSNNMLTRIKKPKDIAEQIGGRHYKAVSEYIEKEKLNGKKEKDFVAAIEYYNSLK
jgi:hypothetical protein